MKTFNHFMSRRAAAVLGTAVTAVLLEAGATPAPNLSPVGSIFVIAMENHNFAQPASQTSPPQIFGNSAAPYINSLVTPGNPNAAQVSYATAYYNAGFHVHPSEPSYVWAEAGTDFGVHTDAEPRDANGNVYNTVHFTAQLNAHGISWRNYQEDVQLSLSPTNNASGVNGPMNPYYGTAEYNYAAKHNPMAFFTDTQAQNVYPISQLFHDLAYDTVARYNWITPNQYNDAHSNLKDGFTYHGVIYGASDPNARIAQGDNFLAQIVPQIMASPAYQNNGVIVIWWDESEGGDDTNRTIPEIIISPLAKGNAYASSVPMSHSSDLKTWAEILGLPFLNNPIPTDETNNFGEYENVATVHDLSDLFVPGIIPALASISVSIAGSVVKPHTREDIQIVRVVNTGATPVSGPLYLALDDLSPDATLLNADGATSALAPLGSPYVRVPVGGDGVLRPHETRVVGLRFANPDGSVISYTPRVLSVAPAP